GEHHILHFIGHAGFDREAQGGCLSCATTRGKGGPSPQRTWVSSCMIIARCASSCSTPAKGHALRAPTRLPASRRPSYSRGSQRLSPCSSRSPTRQQSLSPMSFTPRWRTGTQLMRPSPTHARRSFGVGNDTEWGTPVLYLRAPDGRLFS